MHYGALRAGSAAVVGLALVALSACGGSSTTTNAQNSDATDISAGSAVPTDGPDSTEPTPDVAAPKPPHEQVVEVVEKYLTIRDALELETGDYATEKQFRQYLDKTLPTVTTGYEEKRLREYALEVYRETGFKTVGQYRHDVGDAKRVRGKNEFTVNDCEDHSGLKTLKGGKTTPIKWTGTGGKPLADRLITTYTVRNEGGEWLVSVANLTETPC